MLGGEISTRLTGRVAVIEHQANGRIRLTIDVLATERPKLKYVPQRVRVSARTIPDGLQAGDVVTGVARLGAAVRTDQARRLRLFLQQLFRRHRRQWLFPDRTRNGRRAFADAARTRFFAAVENLRTDLANRIRVEIGGAEGEIAAALVAGVRAGIPEDVNEALRRTGLAHVLSISGLHMALVAATIMAVLRVGFAFFPDFASRHPVKKYAASAALVALAVYLFISGTAVAAERSFIMIGVMLIAVLVRPRGTHHAQPRHLGNRHHRRLAARGGGTELPDVVCRDRGTDRRLCLAGRNAGASSRHRRPQTRAVR